MPAVSLPDARAHLRVTHNDDDPYITDLVAAATDEVEARTRRALVSQVLRSTLRGFQPVICLERAPLVDVVVKYFDEDGVEQTLDPSSYLLIDKDTGGRPFIEFVSGASIPGVAARSDAVSIEMTAGYGENDTFVPPGLRHIIKMIVGHLYANRESVVVAVNIGVVAIEIPEGIEYMMLPWRLY